MDKNKSAVDEFLGNLNPENDEFNDNQDPFAPKEPEQGVKDEEEEIDPKKEEKHIPFHKDPKVLRFIEKEIQKRTTKIEEKPAESKKEDEDDYWVRLIGNDTPEKVAMVREAKQREERLLQQAEERSFNRLSTEKQRELEAERQADEHLANAIDDIEDTYGVDLTSKDPVARKHRVDFMNFIEKIAPKNSDGEIIEFPDMISAYETFKELKQSVKTPNRAKELASRSMGRSNDTVEKPQERITFDNMDSFIEKMFKK